MKTNYELSFGIRTNETRHRATPVLVITMSRRTFEELCDTIASYGEQGGVHPAACNLNDKHPPTFAYPIRGCMGYRSCCRIEDDGERVRLVFELRAYTRDEVAATLSHILDALPSKGEGENILTLHTSTSRGAMHGHAIYGEISTQFGLWLVSQGKVGDPTLTMRVTNAMACAWRAVADVPLRKYAGDCGFSIGEDGRFILGCFGNACDVAVYPEGVIGRMGEYPAQFNSHNLDTVTQQLTLVAGLAMLTMEVPK